jgi:hypothetical protein
VVRGPSFSQRVPGAGGRPIDQSLPEMVTCAMLFPGPGCRARPLLFQWGSVDNPLGGSLCFLHRVTIPGFCFLSDSVTFPRAENGTLSVGIFAGVLFLEILPGCGEGLGVDPKMQAARRSTITKHGMVYSRTRGSPLPREGKTKRRTESGESDRGQVDGLVLA